MPWEWNKVGYYDYHGVSPFTFEVIYGEMMKDESVRWKLDESVYFSVCLQLLIWNVFFSNLIFWYSEIETE